MNSRLQRLEAKPANPGQPINDDLRQMLNAMNSRIDALGRALESMSATVLAAVPPRVPDDAFPEPEPEPEETPQPLAETRDPDGPESMAHGQINDEPAKRGSWMKRLLLGHP